MSFEGRNVVHMDDLATDEILHILDVAEKLRGAAGGNEVLDVAKGKILATIFYEPSTRTRLSFEAAITRLGGSHLGFADEGVSSSMKGETLADTVRVVSGYADAIALRHPREGAARLASRVAGVPVLNAGDGAGQHPTQTLLDLFTIRRAKGEIGGNRVGLLGDLKYGRTVHSLANALARFDAEMVLIAPPGLQMPDETVERLRARGASIETTDDLESVIAELDVLYATRIQKERFPDPEEYERVQGSYRVDLDLLSRAKRSCKVLHPLPRVDEIDPEVDATDHALYFEQAAAGVPVRMAILALILGLMP